MIIFEVKKKLQNMPAKLERCVKDLIKQGKSESSAYAICTASINKMKAANGTKTKTKKK
jgi:hypothetical protein